MSIFSRYVSFSLVNHSLRILVSAQHLIENTVMFLFTFFAGTSVVYPSSLVASDLYLGRLGDMYIVMRE